MQFPTTNVFVAMLAIVSLTTAHMNIAMPVPFAGTDKLNLNNNGSNFPCQNVAYTNPTMNQWPVGSTQNITFIGTATHGGGSCQVAVTTDKAPTPDSVWRVIHSIEGGCPKPPEPKQKGNWDEGTHPPLGSHEFKIPADLPNGDLVFSVVWFNFMGNREMYQWCGAISVSGGAKDTSAFDKLPEMAVANIVVPKAKGCVTKEMFDYTFANPGASVVKNGIGPFAPLCAGDAAPGAPPANPGAPPASSANPVTPPANSGAPPAKSGAPPASSANTGVPSSSAVAPSSSVVPAPSPSKVSAASSHKMTSTVRQSLTNTAPSVSSPTPSTQLGADVVSPPAAKPTPQASQAAPSPAAPAPGGAKPGQSCSPDGSIVCSPDGKQFALCNWGKAVFQPLAAGTTCQGGKVVKRADYASTLKIVYT